ncbi:hypothetical protein [Nostoc sp. NMS8]|uniref:hypothetical protein n=1 Tax=Nostoc sp. NMS8 TaxID=2815392 RepID=UPI0025D0A9EB|nr:hypothetical protein [Nostoc sp. NMS8]MBN3959637.1 hypothetical protein [Nostoc sp. NMS8]
MNSNGLKTFFVHAVDKASFSRSDEIIALSEALKKVDPAGIKIVGKAELYKFGEVEEKLKIVLEKEDLRKVNYFQKSSIFKIFTYFIDSLSNLLVAHSESPEPSFSGVKKSNSSINNDCKLETVSKETLKLTNTHKVQIRQKYKGIPVYGAQVTLEVDEKNDLLAINSASAIGDTLIINTSPEPSIKADDIKDLIQQKTNYNLESLDLNPSLYYYYDSSNKDWRLVYITDIRYTDSKEIHSIVKNPEETDNLESVPDLVDYVVDAHTGDLVDKNPCLRTIQK